MTIDCQFWLTANGEKEKLQLPVNPSKITIDDGTNHDSVMVAELGEILILQSRPAINFSFSSFFPATEFSGIKVKKLTNPQKCIDKIKEWKNNNSPIHFLVTSNHIDIYCVIKSFRYYEQGGDIGTYYYDLTMKEYRQITVRRVKVDISNRKANIEQTKTRIDNTIQSKTYTVVKGDYLWRIAKKIYGNGALYKKIYNANKEVIGGNPNKIRPGQVLIIPT